MVTRVIGIPDKNGIITISCGGDTIEIQVATGSPRESVGAAGGNNPFDDPFAAIAAPIGGHPFDLPGAFFVNRHGPGKLDIDTIVNDLLGQIADQTKTNPSAVVVGTGNANLHELSDLGRRIAREAPELPIAVDFGNLIKR